jgi:hypothetical protein
MLPRHTTAISGQAARLLEIGNEPGWVGAFTRQQAKGAWPNGTRVVKIAEDPSGDLSPPGSEGAVLGSVSVPERGVAYFIEWDHQPKHAVVCVGWKLNRLV